LTIYVWLPVGFLLFFVAIPALIAAISFRGGLVLLAFGLGVVREDGLPASRIRVFWRSLLTWSVLFIPDVVGRGATGTLLLAQGNRGFGYPDDDRLDCLVHAAARPRHPGQDCRYTVGTPITPASGPSDLSKLTAERNRSQ
jgi:hypothetical protein